MFYCAIVNACHYHCHYSSFKLLRHCQSKVLLTHIVVTGTAITYIKNAKVSPKVSNFLTLSKRHCHQEKFYKRKFRRGPWCYCGLALNIMVIGRPFTLSITLLLKKRIGYNCKSLLAPKLTFSSSPKLTPSEVTVPVLILPVPVISLLFRSKFPPSCGVVSFMISLAIPLTLSPVTVAPVKSTVVVAGKSMLFPLVPIVISVVFSVPMLMLPSVLPLPPLILTLPPVVPPAPPIMFVLPPVLSPVPPVGVVLPPVLPLAVLSPRLQ